MSRRIIRANRVGELQRLPFGPVGAGIGAEEEPVEDRDNATDEAAAAETAMAERIAEREREGFDRGYERGFEEGRMAGAEAGFRDGRAQAEAEASVVRNRLLSLTSSIAAACDEVDSAISESLVGLALELARVVIGREPATQTETLRRLVKEALAVAPIEVGVVHLHVHPDDAADLQRGTLALPSNVHLVEDGEIERGGCVVAADLPQNGARDRRWRIPGRKGQFEVDATLAARWRNAMRALFGEGTDATSDGRKSDQVAEPSAAATDGQAEERENPGEEPVGMVPSLPPDDDDAASQETASGHSLGAHDTPPGAKARKINDTEKAVRSVSGRSRTAKKMPARQGRSRRER